MSNPSPHSQPAANTSDTTANQEPMPMPTAEPPPSYVKLAMRNMVKKGGKSLYHFALTTVGLLALLVGLAYLTH
ncbi:DUF3285 domain-containing protein [Leptolyngbya sp. AN02str]|uniref:DUF3285 domain-containing protein n=1 Tax=Leptolyngbya sp. AN02str TaxID=3423363 RepID=UPI003D31E531